jgi:hypothetical protein
VLAAAWPGIPGMPGIDIGRPAWETALPVPGCAGRTWAVCGADGENPGSAAAASRSPKEIVSRAWGRGNAEANSKTKSAVRFLVILVSFFIS